MVKNRTIKQLNHIHLVSPKKKKKTVYSIYRVKDIESLIKNKKKKKYIESESESSGQKGRKTLIFSLFNKF